MCFCFLQRKNRGSIARQQTVLKTDTERADEANDITANSNVSSADTDKPVVDKLLDSPVYGDHLYCRIETERVPSNQSAEPVLTDISANTELTETLSSESSTGCVKTELELFDEVSVSNASGHSRHSVCSSSDETCNSESTLLRCYSAETMQSLDTVSTLRETSELDIAGTEDVSLSSSVGTVTDSKSDPSTDSVSCEVVDLSDGRCVELECQCGAHYSDPNDKLHVVECQHCHSHQHATCVNYDLTDPLRGNYLCPHCRVIEVCSLHGYVEGCTECSVYF